MNEEEMDAWPPQPQTSIYYGTQPPRLRKRSKWRDRMTQFGIMSSIFTIAYAIKRVADYYNMRFSGGLGLGDKITFKIEFEVGDIVAAIIRHIRLLLARAPQEPTQRLLTRILNYVARTGLEAAKSPAAFARWLGTRRANPAPARRRSRRSRRSHRSPRSRRSRRSNRGRRSRPSRCSRKRKKSRGYRKRK